MRLLILALIASALSAQEWSKTDIGLELAEQALILADYRQTSDIWRHDMHETNRWLGIHPHQRGINQWFLGMSLGHWVVSDLAGSHRRFWQVSTLTLGAYTVAGNAKLGLCITF